MSNILACMSKPLGREFERAAQYGALRHQLIVLKLRGTVGDDTAPGLIAVSIAAKDQRADRDGLVHIASLAEIAPRPAIKLAAHRLELIDQLHGAHLRSTDQSPCGKRGREQVESVLA